MSSNTEGPKIKSIMEYLDQMDEYVRLPERIKDLTDEIEGLQVPAKSTTWTNRKQQEGSKLKKEGKSRINELPMLEIRTGWKSHSKRLYLMDLTQVLNTASESLARFEATNPIITTEDWEAWFERTKKIFKNESEESPEKWISNCHSYMMARLRALQELARTPAKIKDWPKFINQYATVMMSMQNLIDTETFKQTFTFSIDNFQSSDTVIAEISGAKEQMHAFILSQQLKKLQTATKAAVLHLNPANSAWAQLKTLLPQRKRGDAKAAAAHNAQQALYAEVLNTVQSLLILATINNDFFIEHSVVADFAKLFCKDPAKGFVNGNMLSLEEFLDPEKDVSTFEDRLSRLNEIATKIENSKHNAEDQQAKRLFLDAIESAQAVMQMQRIVAPQNKQIEANKTRVVTNAATKHNVQQSNETPTPDPYKLNSEIAKLLRQHRTTDELTSRVELLKSFEKLIPKIEQLKQDSQTTLKAQLVEALAEVYNSRFLFLTPRNNSIGSEEKIAELLEFKKMLESEFLSGSKVASDWKGIIPVWINIEKCKIYLSQLDVETVAPVVLEKAKGFLKSVETGSNSSPSLLLKGEISKLKNKVNEIKEKNAAQSAVIDPVPGEPGGVRELIDFFGGAGKYKRPPGPGKR